MSRLKFTWSVYNNMRVLPKEQLKVKTRDLMASAIRTIIFLMWIAFGMTTLPVCAGK